MRKARSLAILCALSSIFLAVGTVEGQPPNSFNPMLPYHPEELYAYHYAARVNFAECMIELEDGSQWKASDSDRVQLLSWRSDDFVVVTPNHTYSDFTFYITNQVNGSYVRVNLVNGPSVGGAYTMLISGLDINNRYKRSVYISNGTAWAIDEGDFHRINTWQVGDPIIVGRNDSWFTSYRILLINVLTNTYVRARKI